MLFKKTWWEKAKLHSVWVTPLPAGAPLLLTLLWTLLIYCQAQSEAAAASWAGHQAAPSHTQPPAISLCPFMVESDAARRWQLYIY